MSEETWLQSFQQGPDQRGLQLEVHYHPESCQYFFLWDNNLQTFPGATKVLNGIIVIAWSRDVKLRL
ncbi:hypothetical protein EC957_003923 [Mortierella hygrophila]|uniref:Uncharacterized protein n=1 Tax=Mortierella hygrophila TaxID=979708 RepID=A0A9P6K0I8_9FUNG|nr:hypothetical protein EC957_003923 [Mortierella hygrophila]